MVMCPCKRGGPCAPRGKLCVPPTPPPPPPPPFPWHYYWPFAAYFALFGLIYQMYRWKMEANKRNEVTPTWRPRQFARRPIYNTDLPAKVQYLIIGAGTAGMAAYSAIMRHDPCAKVFLINLEDSYPYERPPLAKGLWLNPKPPDIETLLWTNGQKKVSMYYLKPQVFMNPIEFYRRRTGPAVALASGWKVTRLDADQHLAFIGTRGGEQPMEYDKCLIAVGSKPRNLDVFRTAPYAVRDKVCRLRTIRDAEYAWRKLERAKRCVIIGAGPLGCELSWTLGQLYNKTERDEEQNKVEIVHIFKDKGILSTVIPDYLSEWAAEKLKEQEVVLLPKTEVHDAYLNPENDRLMLTLCNGKEIETDYVFVCVGAEPQTELAAPSELELDPVRGGFLVNGELMARTDLYVAGDAASHYQPWRGARARYDKYEGAVETGCVAGENMTGRWQTYNLPAQFWVHLGEHVNMQAIGEVSSCMTTVGVFQKCTMEEKAGIVKAVSGGGGGADKPCYKKTEEYKMRYEKGIIYYMDGEIVKGVVFWNIDKSLMPDREDVCAALLRASPTYDDIEMITELLHFHEDKC